MTVRYRVDGVIPSGQTHTRIEFRTLTEALLHQKAWTVKGWRMSEPVAIRRNATGGIPCE